jgi:hypothetical protein
MNPHMANIGAAPAYSSSTGFTHSRQAFHRPAGLGVAGHWIHLGAVLSPLVIGEMIPDPDKRWRAIRLSTAVAAVASEALWTHRLIKKRAHEEEREHEIQR